METRRTTRRVSRPVGNVGPTRPQRLRSRGIAERAKSMAPASGKVVVALVFVWGMYILFGSGNDRGDVLAGRGEMVTVEQPASIGAAASSEGTEHARHPKSFRQLSMLGYEKDGGGQEAWKTCRAYREEALPPNKKPEERGFDIHLQPVRPTEGASWDFQITLDQEAEWLGLHQWDDRFKYGSEEADRRVAKLGYCRVHMPSVPRTGSTWFRAMFETATGQPTFSMWQEGGTKKEKYKAFSSDDPCGASLDHMEGNLWSQKAFPCREIRPPNATSPILYKSHTPFFPSYNKPSLMPEETCMIVLLVRNPIDNQDAWMRYMAGKGQILRDYLPVWQGHTSHWIAAAGDIPIYVFRYEDMLLRAEDVLRRMLQAMPEGFNWSEESIAKAMSMYGPKKPFEEKCGSGIKGSSVAEVEMVRKHYGSFLKHFGYRFAKIS